MKNKMKLFCDLDDTLVQFCSHWIKWLEVKGIATNLTTADISNYSYIIDTYGEDVKQFYLKDPQHIYKNVLKPIKGSQEFFDWCNKNYDVYILSYASKKAQKAKRDFVKKYYDTDKIMFVENLHDKSKITNGSILIDDYPINIINHILDNKTHGIIYNHNNNNSWCKLINYPEFMKIHSSTMIDVTKFWNVSSYEQIKIILERVNQ